MGKRKLILISLIGGLIGASALFSCNPKQEQAATQTTEVIKKSIYDQLKIVHSSDTINNFNSLNVRKNIISKSINIFLEEEKLLDDVANAINENRIRKIDKITDAYNFIVNKYKYDKADIGTPGKILKMKPAFLDTTGLQNFANELETLGLFWENTYNYKNVKKINPRFIDEEGVCRDFAPTLKGILDRLGIENSLVMDILEVNLENGCLFLEGTHIWNKVKIGNEHYNLCTTMKLFLVSDKTMGKPLSRFCLINDGKRIHPKAIIFINPDLFKGNNERDLRLAITLGKIQSPPSLKDYVFKGSITKEVPEYLKKYLTDGLDKKQPIIIK